MGQKRNRAGNNSQNRNERSISNSREVSRRTKGKNRYAFEEDRRTTARYYDDDGYYQSEPKRRKKSASVKNRDSEYDSKGRKRKRRGRRKNVVSKTIGIILAIIQFVLSVVLTVNVLFFDMLTVTYIMVLAGVLLILLGITLLSQIGAKGKGIGGKIFCIFLCIILAMGSFYIGKINNAFQKITGSNTMTSSMVVAVRQADTAQKLVDTADYTYGVQYATNADQTKSTIKQVEKEIGSDITLQEYTGMIEAAQALLSGEVDALVYNSGQTGIIKDQIPDFENEIRVIYKHSIVVQIENTAADASVTEPFAVYLSGMDTYNDITSGDRSDVNIIAVVNPKSHQILLITTPRDYYVPIPGISNGQEDKLTHAGIYGIEASMDTLEELYDMEIPFFGRVNFTSMINIVDALGGLDVVSDEEFDTGEESGKVIHINEGMNHLDGRETLAFCRERHALADGDNARGRHQQAVITAIIQKMMSPSMLRGASDIIASVSDGVDTNFSMSQIQSLIKTQLRTNAEWNICSVSAEGFGDKQYCYSSGDTLLYVCIPDEESVANIIDLVNRVEAGEVLEESTVVGQ
ncbi:MAG: LCP family protein [Bariatricus sp.]